MDLGACSHRYHVEDQLPGEEVIPSLLWKRNGIADTSRGFQSDGGKVKHERTFSNWLGGKKIVKRKT